MPMKTFSVGDRVTCDFHHGIPATITELHEGDYPGSPGFKYVLDRPHDFGPRRGLITYGTALVTDGWRHIGPALEWPVIDESLIDQPKEQK